MRHLGLVFYSPPSVSPLSVDSVLRPAAGLSLGISKIIFWMFPGRLGIISPNSRIDCRFHNERVGTALRLPSHRLGQFTAHTVDTLNLTCLVRNTHSYNPAIRIDHSHNGYCGSLRIRANALALEGLPFRQLAYVVNSVSHLKWRHHLSRHTLTSYTFLASHIPSLHPLIFLSYTRGDTSSLTATAMIIMSHSAKIMKCRETTQTIPTFLL